MRKLALVSAVAVFSSACLLAQAKGGADKPFMPKYSVEEAHEFSIYGIKVGMTTPEVLDRLGGRMPDKREDKAGEIVVYWKTEEGILQVRFRDENYVSYVGLQYAPVRPTNDFWLRRLKDLGVGRPTPFVTTGPGTTVADRPIDPNATEAPRLSSSQGPSELTGTDPRLRRDYKLAETVDKERTVWTREMQGSGFSVDVGFISADKKKMGTQFEEWIQFKYVQVEVPDLKKFDHWANQQRGQK